jgi:hypothetical protein
MQSLQAWRCSTLERSMERSSPYRDTWLRYSLPRDTNRDDTHGWDHAVAPCAQLPLHSLRRLVLSKEQHVYCVRKHVHNFLKVDLATDLYLYLLISLKNNPAHDFSHVYDSLDWYSKRAAESGESLVWPRLDWVVTDRAAPYLYPLTQPNSEGWVCL